VLFRSPRQLFLHGFFTFPARTRPRLLPPRRILLPIVTPGNQCPPRYSACAPFSRTIKDGIFFPVGVSCPPCSSPHIWSMPKIFLSGLSRWLYSFDLSFSSSPFDRNPSPVAIYFPSPPYGAAPSTVLPALLPPPLPKCNIDPNYSTTVSFRSLMDNPFLPHQPAKRSTHLFLMVSFPIPPLCFFSRAEKLVSGRAKSPVYPVLNLFQPISTLRPTHNPPFFLQKPFPLR